MSYTIPLPPLVDDDGSGLTGTKLTLALINQGKTNIEQTFGPDLEYLMELSGSDASDNLTYTWNDTDGVIVAPGFAITDAGTRHEVAADTEVNFTSHLDTGTKAANTVYYLWIGLDSVSGSVALRLSASATSPTNLTDAYRLGEYVKTDYDGDLIEFPDVLPFRGTLPAGHNTVRSNMIRGTVTDASNATPIVITTAANHGRSTGDRVSIAGVAGNTAANGSWDITVIDDTSFSLDTSAGTGAYTSGGVWTWLDGIQVEAGGQARASDGTVYTIPTNEEVGFASNLPSGVSEAANTNYYLWVGTNSDGDRELVLAPSATTVPDEHGSATALTSPCRLPGLIANRAGGSNDDIAVFLQYGNWQEYLYDIDCDGTDTTQVLDASVGTSAVTIDCSAWVPAETEAHLVVAVLGQNVYIRRYGDTVWTALGQHQFAPHQVYLQLDSSSRAEVKNAGAATTRISVRRFKCR